MSPKVKIIFVPSRCPEKFPDGFANAGSCVILGEPKNWDLAGSRKHSADNLCIHQHVLYANLRQGRSICPGKPGLYLVDPVLAEKITLYKLTWGSSCHV